MAYDAGDLMSRIHIAQCSGIAALKTEAELYLSQAPSGRLNLFINGWGRELNKRSMLTCGSGIYPSRDGGGRPYNSGQFG